MKRFYLYFLLLFSISLHANEQCDLIASIYGAEAGFNYQTMVVKTEVELIFILHRIRIAD